VVAALSKAVGRGTSFGAPTEAETQLTSVIISAMPSIQMCASSTAGPKR